jgi:cytoskeletal protein CcmA (bactofilin family)
MSAAPLPAGLPVGPVAPKATQPDPDPRPTTANAVQPPDNGLGVPPFRPAPLKDAQNMSRPPFSTAPVTPATPATAVRPATAMSRPASRDPSDRRTLVVGRGISVQGVVQDAERLVVEGTVEATMIHATELSIAPGGVFKGEVEVEDAEIAGTIDGTLTVRGSLVIRGTGRVLGTARCRRLQVEDGGQITGRMEMITDQPQSDLPVRQTVEQPAI